MKAVNIIVKVTNIFQHVYMLTTLENASVLLSISIIKTGIY